MQARTRPCERWWYVAIDQNISYGTTELGHQQRRKTATSYPKKIVERNWTNDQPWDANVRNQT